MLNLTVCLVYYTEELYIELHIEKLKLNEDSVYSRFLRHTTNVFCKHSIFIWFDQQSLTSMLSLLYETDI